MLNLAPAPGTVKTGAGGFPGTVLVEWLRGK